MLKSIKTLLLGIFLISPIVLLGLYTVHSLKAEKEKATFNVSKLKLVTPVAIIDEITKKIEEGDLEDALLKINNELPDPNIPSSNGTPLLVLVAEKDYTDILVALIQKGANPDKEDLNTSETPLIKAVKNQNFDTVAALLNAGADPNLGTKQGVTPLGVAIDLKNEGLATLLLSSGAINGVSQEKMFLYAFQKNPIGINLMLAGGIPPSVTDQDNNTPLMISAANGDLESAKQLISYRANVNVKNKVGMTPLLYAVKGKHWDMADYLIRSGAKINASNIYGQNALFWAAYHGNSDLVHSLLMRGADYKKKTRRGQTALQMAKALGHTETVKMLEDFIAYKNLPRDSKGNIILPKVSQQENQQTDSQQGVSPSSLQNAEGASIGSDIVSEIQNQAQQNQGIPQQSQNIQQTVSQTQPSQTIQNQVKTSVQRQVSQPIQKQNVTQHAETQVNNLSNQQTQPKQQSRQEQVDMPQMPGGMDMNAIMSMMGDQGGAQNAQMADMLKQMQNMSAAGQNGDKTQQLQGMPANVQIPAGMDINSIMSMSPEQLKQMGVPEEQIKTITQARQQMGQIQNMSGANNSLQTQNMSGTYANGTPKTQINKLQTSGN